MSRPHDRTIKVRAGGIEREVDIYTQEGYEVLSELWTRSGWNQKLSYEPAWLGIPIIQTPEDIVILQELIWRVRPDLIVESGVAHGGALVLYASMLQLVGKGHVVGLDVEIRKHNRLAIQAHPLSDRITLMEGGSTDPDIVESVQNLIQRDTTVMVMLDSDHSRDHVRRELELYAPMVSPGSYVVVFDSVMRLVADSPRGSESWEVDNPGEAVREFLLDHPEFEVDHTCERLGVTYCRGGYLKKRPD